MSDEGRSQTIDYLRAFSILWVLGYHFVPLNIFSNGTDGVLLFFIISGYCISRSASTSRSAWHFYANRLGRLLPALVVCSFITTAAKHGWPNLIEANRIPSWFDMAYTWFALPTLNILRVNYIRPDGAYWSLNVEFQFYLLYFGIMLVGLRKYVLEIVCGWIAVNGRISQPGDLRSLDFFPYFVAGLSVAAFFSDRRRLAYCGVAFAFAADLYFFLRGFRQPAAPIEFSRLMVLWIGTFTLFLAVKFRPPATVEKLLKPFAFIGLVSYPLYLLHQDSGQMILNCPDIPDTATATSILLRGFVLIPFMIMLAEVIHRGFEKPFIAPLTAMLAGRTQQSRLETAKRLSEIKLAP